MKKILITGCSGSIGKEIANYFEIKNYKIIGLDLKSPPKEILRKIEFFKCNLNSEQSVKKTYKKIIKKHNNIDILINAAGYIHNELFLEYKGKFKYHNTSEWKKTFEFNINTVFFTVKYFLQLLINSKKKNKLIINFSSVNSDGIVGQAAYSASKKAIEILTKVWSKEFSPFRIRVACIAPGYIDLKSTMNNTKKKDRLKILSEIPLKKFGNVKDLLDGINFLIDNEYFNGKILKIDGGL